MLFFPVHISSLISHIATATLLLREKIRKSEECSFGFPDMRMRSVVLGLRKEDRDRLAYS